eukprot:CAMPEP_0202457944 /NCGR_PEP_ID=MMETSP1360-20130828/18213_1 /ASSEMBLY_ACC=CAM_ASM_000848 /TAXON_ID=515479 /ORGANISM="Licmophora paradoxa, Strain CCMP2313" /LENGTH=78 /DNA_ID=CAMNT_0049078187 /DNA_START=48 /DNA_END=284 /DNA_ORIENTATION=+
MITSIPRVISNKTVVAGMSSSMKNVCLVNVAGKITKAEAAVPAAFKKTLKEAGISLELTPGVPPGLNKPFFVPSKMVR